jgi:hypothetical protein
MKRKEIPATEALNTPSPKDVLAIVQRYKIINEKQLFQLVYKNTSHIEFESLINTLLHHNLITITRDENNKRIIRDNPRNVNI